MAANMKAVKLRIKSVQSTMQITKAMELVASSKLRKAKERADTCRPYFKELYKTLQDIAEENVELTSAYVKETSNEKHCYVVIAGDRGLAGGYNSNLFKALEADAQGKDYVVLPIGKKTVEYFHRRGVRCITEEFAEIAGISVSDCFEMARMVCAGFLDGEYGHIHLCYTGFISMLSQRPNVVSVLPLSELSEKKDGSGEKAKNLILYEPDSETVFDAVVPEYVAGVLYGGVCEALASELAARRMAMESATGNAEEMIEKLNLHYNRVRQASITQEITEIVGGAEGI